MHLHVGGEAGGEGPVAQGVGGTDGLLGVIAHMIPGGIGGEGDAEAAGVEIQPDGVAVKAGSLWLELGQNPFLVTHVHAQVGPVQAGEADGAVVEIHLVDDGAIGVADGDAGHVVAEPDVCAGSIALVIGIVFIGAQADVSAVIQADIG